MLLGGTSLEATEIESFESEIKFQITNPVLNKYIDSLGKINSSLLTNIDVYLSSIYDYASQSLLIILVQYETHTSRFS